MQVQLDGYSIQSTEYICTYKADTQTIMLSGMLRLDGVQGYEAIAKLLSNVANQDLPHVTLDLQYLDYLNSSGITTISRFILALRQRGRTDLVIQASSQIPWQERSMKNLVRLMPKIQLEML